MMVRAHDRETVDMVCWRSIGRTRGVVEIVLADNPGLAAQGGTLSAGTVVYIRDDLPTRSPERTTRKLWD